MYGFAMKVAPLMSYLEDIMGKDKTPPKFGERQAGATAKFLRIPPRKARLVLDAVRGKYVNDALATLKFVPNFAARAIEDVINSAVANSENSRPLSELTGRQLPPLNPDNLKLVRGWVDEGPRIKRLQPRAQGRAYRILKRMCHISVIVEETDPKPRAVRRQITTRRDRVQGATLPVETEKAPEITAPAVETVVLEQQGTSVNTENVNPPVAESAHDAPADKTPNAE